MQLRHSKLQLRSPHLAQVPWLSVASIAHSRALAGRSSCAAASVSGTPAALEPAPAAPVAAEEAKKSDEYSAVMNRKMGTSLQYRHELGIDYNRILPDLIVGSCLQTAADVDRLAEQEGVTTIVNLQEDCDMAYFKLDLAPIQARCKERGDVQHVRFPIRDFDPYDLRRKLPKAVARLAREHDPTRGTMYIHCTAGMGRAPATALAYMFWIRGMQLDHAYSMLTSMRRCGPKIEAIRSATCDLLLGTQPVPTTIAVHRSGGAQRIQVAGLDVGWHAPLDMVRESKPPYNFVLHRDLYPGKYQYKLIVDGHWTYSADHPTARDNDNINNTLEVIPAQMDTMTIQTQIRLLTAGTSLTDVEQAELRAMLCPWATHDMAWGPTTPAQPQADPVPAA